MYFYTLSQGENNSYEKIILYHKIRYTADAFCDIYDYIVNKNEMVDIYKISKIMVENFEFRILESEIEINSPLLK